MSRFLLFTQCLQNDFVAPVAAGERIPNQLHIGREESRRLVGDVPAEGPLGRFLEAFYKGAGSDHAVVHIRDWHDSSDPAQAHHLAHFGPHCLKNSRGAEFVEPLDRLARGAAPTLTVDSTMLNDFEGTDLKDRILRLLGGTKPADAVAGIVGVWTDVKVQYLAYDLLTRVGIQKIALCSALVASRSRVRHFQALDLLAQNLAVQVVDGIPEFLSILGVGCASTYVPSRRYGVRISGASLDGEDLDLVQHLFRHCRTVELSPLSGGFSGARVFRSSSVDQDGRREVPFVVKTDALQKISKERAAVERIENVLGASAPAMSDFVDGPSRGAIKYFFASMHHSPVATLQQRFQKAAGPDQVRDLFRQLWDDILVRLLQTPLRDRLQLFQYYRFSPEYASHTLERFASLSKGLDLPDPAAFYRDLDRRLARDPMDAAVCWLHGDLNLANALMDDAGNTWLIDYFHAGPGHSLQDAAKLENDLKFIMLPLPDDASLKRARRYEEWLLAQRSLLEPPGDLPIELDDPALAKVHAAVREIRGWLRELCAGLPGMEPWWIAQLRYAAHTMGFDECDERQRKHAAIATALLAEKLA